MRVGPTEIISPRALVDLIIHIMYIRMEILLLLEDLFLIQLMIPTARSPYYSDGNESWFIARTGALIYHDGDYDVNFFVTNSYGSYIESLRI